MTSLIDAPADLQNHAARAPTQDARPALGWILTLGGVIGLASAAMLTIEKIHVLEQPNAALSCDLSAFVSCGGVINTDQASAFRLTCPGFSGHQCWSENCSE